jgi:hypothetical protein
LVFSHMLWSLVHYSSLTLIPSKALSILKRIAIPMLLFDNGKKKATRTYLYKTKCFYQLLYFFQLVFPFRYLLYPNELFGPKKVPFFLACDANGKRLSTFKVRDAVSKEITINNSHFWLHFQEKQMAFQPDFILNMLITSIIIIKKQGYQSWSLRWKLSP